jgi:hypothetical protein
MPALTSLQSLILQGQVWFWPLLFILDTRALILMIFSGTLYGAIWTIRISGTIAHQQAHGMVDLLCLSPSGRIGMNWAICTGCLHRHAAFAQINSQEAWIARLILFIPFIVSANIIFGRVFANSGWITLIWLATFILLFYLDHVQSILIGCLIGVLIPQRTANRFEAPFLAGVGFILLQLFTYALVIGVIVFGLPGLYNILHVAGVLAEISRPIVCILVFFGVREGIMVWLWNRVIRELNTMPTEFNSLFRQSFPPEWTAAQ